MGYRPLILAVFLLACGGEEKSSEFIPNVDVLCTAAQATDCSGDALPVFIGMKDVIEPSCDDFLTGMNTTQRRNSFQASGEAFSSRSGIYLIAQVNEWVNDHGGSIDVLEPGTYEVCAFIDTNQNGLLDTNEPVADGEVTVGTTGFELNNWYPAFN